MYINKSFVFFILSFYNINYLKFIQTQQENIYQLIAIINLLQIFF